MQHVTQAQRGAFLGLVSVIRDQVRSLEAEGTDGAIAPGYVHEKCDQIVLLSQQLKQYADLIHGVAASREEES